MIQKLIKSSVLLFWFVMLGLLFYRSYIRPTSVIALDVITEEGVRTGEEWFGIYQQGRKTGWAHLSTTLEGTAYHLFEESELDIKALDTVQRVRTVINSYATKNLLLKYFDFTLESSLTRMFVKGAVVKNMLVLDITSGGQTRTERVKLAEPIYLSPHLKPALVLMGLEPGRKYRFPIFNPATMSRDDAFVTVEGIETIKIGDREERVYRLSESFQGMEATSWINESGDTLKETSALGYVLLRESRAEAKRLDKEGPLVDVVSLTRIPSDPLPDAGVRTSLTVRLKNADLAGFDLDGDRQTLSGGLLTVSADEAPVSYSLPSRDPERAAFLRPTALIQSDDPLIRQETRRILAGEKDARAAALKLNQWVYASLRKQAVVSIPSAVEVLKQKVGDCNEHTALYTALARAAGIPTRMAAGIVYLENGFYYHAWPEVWLGRWMAIDPTFGQFPADATHIRFTAGNLERQADIMRLVGKLKVEVVGFE